MSARLDAGLFRFGSREALSTGVHRTARREIQAALRRLDTLREDTDTAVHEIRKHCKKIRGLARLVRYGVGGDEYAWVNRQARDTARMFSSARDNRVCIDALEIIRAEDSPPLDFPEAFDRIRAILAEGHRRSLRPLAESAVLEESARLALCQVCQRIAAWKVPDGADGACVVREGLRRTYRRGQARMAEAAGARDPDPRAFHEWRKRVKYLWYQLQLIRPAWPERLDVDAAALHELSDWLGDANDLTALAGSPPILRGTSGLPGARLVYELARSRRTRLWTQSLELGRRLYAEEPDAFAGRMAAYVKLWQVEHRGGSERW